MVVNLSLISFIHADSCGNSYLGKFNDLFMKFNFFANDLIEMCVYGILFLYVGIVFIKLIFIQCGQFFTCIPLHTVD